MTKELLIKFLSNRCAPSELDEIVQWVGREALSDKSRGLAYNDWKSFKTAEYISGDDKKFSYLLDKIHHRINIDSLNATTGGRRKTLTSIVTWITRAAAVLLIPVLTFLVYTLTDNSFHLGGYPDMVVDSLEIIAPVGSRTVVQLSDGTEVHLNYGSKIKYPRTFTGNIRELSLSGEGYFNVAHNPENPFIVKTKRLNVKALGTKFNVNAYPGNDLVATTLVEGKVVLEQVNANGSIKTIGAMVPGQHIDYNIVVGLTASTKGNINKYIAWKDGLLVFDNANIREVADRLESMFNVDIEIDDEIMDYTYTVTFVDEPLSQILDLVAQATPVSCTVFARAKLPDGTYTKQKILLKKK